MTLTPGFNPALEPVRDDSRTPTCQDLEEARRVLYRIAEYNATIDALQQRVDRAQALLTEHQNAKERFIESIPTSPFWLPTSVRLQAR